MENVGKVCGGWKACDNDKSWIQTLQYNVMIMWMMSYPTGPPGWTLFFLYLTTILVLNDIMSAYLVQTGVLAVGRSHFLLPFHLDADLEPDGPRDGRLVRPLICNMRHQLDFVPPVQCGLKQLEMSMKDTW